MNEPSAVIEWDSPEGRKWVSKIENGLAFVKTEGQAFAQILPEAEITAEIRRDTANVASRKKARAQSEIETAHHERNLAEKRGLHGFTAGMSSVKARKIEEVLHKQQGFSGKIMRRRDFIERSVESGARVVHSRSGRILEMPGGSFYTEKDVTKVALDYAEFLKA